MARLPGAGATDARPAMDTLQTPRHARVPGTRVGEGDTPRRAQSWGGGHPTRRREGPQRDRCHQDNEGRGSWPEARRLSNNDKNDHKTDVTYRSDNRARKRRKQKQKQTLPPPEAIPHENSTPGEETEGRSHVAPRRRSRVKALREDRARGRLRPDASPASEYGRPESVRTP